MADNQNKKLKTLTLPSADGSSVTFDLYPDWENIENKPETFGVGQFGTGEGAEIFNDYTNNIASGNYSHAEGYATNAEGEFSHAEGSGTQATNDCAHAEGGGTFATGVCAHAEGEETEASGYASHAEGQGSRANGIASHAEGLGTSAFGQASHVEGIGTGTNIEGQHVQGKYNIADTEGAYAHIVGNGTNNNNRSNAHTLDWDGNAWYAGSMTATKMILGAEGYGTELPTTGVEGQIFFLISDESFINATDDGSGIITIK